MSCCVCLVTVHRFQFSCVIFSRYCVRVLCKWMIFSCVVSHCHLSCLWIDLFMTLHLFKASKHNTNTTRPLSRHKHTHKHTHSCVRTGRSVCVTERWCVWIRAVRLTADENNIYCVNSFRRCRNIRCEEITRETPHSSQLKGNYGIDFKHTEWKQSTFTHDISTVSLTSSWVSHMCLL